MRALLCLTFASTLAACGVGAPARTLAPADSAAGATAFTLDGPGGAALVVPAHVNGRGPYRFVLDTGATITCIDGALADSLGLPTRPGAAFGAGIGGAGAVRLVDVDSFRVGASQAYGLTACTLDLSVLEGAGLRVDGLVGLNFLRAYRVGLDFERNVLTLAAP